MSAFDSILLIAFGGPDKPEDIRPFLEIVAQGRRIPRERLEEVVHHYELMGGRSPLTELTLRQARGLRRELEKKGVGLPVYVGMRNWHPFIHETLVSMAEQGSGCALGIILSAFQTEASWERYMKDVEGAREKVGAGAPAVSYMPGWSGHPLFIEGTAATVRDALQRLGAGKLAKTALVFTAHSIPKSMADSSPYAAQFIHAAREVSRQVGHRHWSVAYQSRSGRPDDPWLEPDISDRLGALGGEGFRDVVVVPLGFVCDHVEVLYDLDFEARQTARALGLRFHRVPAANDQPYFIALLADLVQKGLSRA